MRAIEQLLTTIVEISNELAKLKGALPNKVGIRGKNEIHISFIVNRADVF